MTDLEVVAVFHSAQQFQEAIDQLLVAGFNHADISLLASDRAVSQNLDQYRRTEDFNAHSNPNTTAYISPESRGDGYGAIIGSLMFLGGFGTAGLIVASGGAIAAAIIATTVSTGAGAVLGTVLSHMLEKHHADNLARQIAQGGLLLWVRAWDDVHEARAIEILKRLGGEDVHSHKIPDV